MKNMEIGSISHGTLRPQDLIPTFLALALDHDCKLGALVQLQAETTDLDDGHEYWTSEDSQMDIDYLIEYLDSLSPPLCYFGALEGDGSDYGYWISMDSIDTAIYDGEVERSDKSGRPPEGYEFRLHVNDHGNMALYNHEGKEVWSVV